MRISDWSSDVCSSDLKRQIFLDATAEGRQRLADAPDMLQEVFAHRFAALPSWEQAMVLAGAERLAAILGAGETAAAPLLDAGLIARAGASDVQSASGPPLPTPSLHPPWHSTTSCEGKGVSVRVVPCAC